ncbi:thioredoxin family protein, partial [Desulfovibrio sp. OttesenSCG-928-I05]|nr:thioredoxin family protein [Desulfovibrio sp. OttesenSCG-928-I05]
MALVLGCLLFLVPGAANDVLAAAPSSLAGNATPVISGKAIPPVHVEHAWYAADMELPSITIPGAPSVAPAMTQRAVLALRVVPAEGSYIYGGASRSAAGKPTALALGYSGDTAVTERLLRETRALFPPPAEKNDRWSGSQALVYDQAIRIVVPLAHELLPSGAEKESAFLLAEISGLACSDKNCTPFSLPLHVDIPESAATLPPLSREEWAAKLADYGPESLVALSVPGRRLDLGQTGLASDLAPNLASGMLAGTGGSSLQGGQRSLQTAETPRIPELTPVYFVPELEVSSLGKAMLLGFLAGILLNVMPCVLPVLGLKLSSLMMGARGESDTVRRRLFVRHQLWFSAGIMAWFTVLSLVLGLANLAWGQLFQFQGLVLGLTVFLFLLALNLFGVFSLPILDLGTKSGSSSLQAFSGGFTATLLATPCSGPLLGGVLSWALLQPPLFMLISLWCVGLGMSLPYLLMVLKPGLLTRLPKPGPWMRYMEGAFGFLLLAAAAYLATLLPPAQSPRVFGSLVMAGLAAWLWGQVATPTAPRGTRRIARVMAGLLIAASLYWPLAARSTGFAWKPYDEAAFASQLGKQPMIVEFTADWCPTCKVVEATTLASERMVSLQKQYGFTAVRVDLTRDSEQGQSLLRSLGSASIPLIALFPAGDAARSPLVLRDVVTKNQL